MDRKPSAGAGIVRRSFVRDSVLAYLAVRPVGFMDSVRLYIGYAAALRRRMLVNRLGAPVGAVVPGTNPLTVSFSGLRARVRPGTNDLDLLVHHEPLTRSWFRPRSGELVVDVGAHIGRYTLLGAKAGACVISVEPDPSNFRILEANVRLNQLERVSLLRAGLSNCSGVREFHLSEGTNRGTSSFFRTDPWVGGARRTIAVDCLTLDELADREGIERIDWLKIDVEGHEAEVLEGAVRSLRVTRNLILEVTEGNEAVCRQRLAAADLRLRDVEPGHPASNWFLEGAL